MVNLKDLRMYRVNVHFNVADLNGEAKRLDSERAGLQDANEHLVAQLEKEQVGQSRTSFHRCGR